MSKVTVTFTDTIGEDGEPSVSINTEFDPPVINDAGQQTEMTGAQYMAVKALHLAVNDNKDVAAVKETPKDFKLKPKQRIITSVK